MREIDFSEDNSEIRLRRALRSLSAASATEAPPEIGDSLAAAFRHHHARRKVRRTAMASIMLAFALASVVVVVKGNRDRPSIAKVPATVTVPPAATQAPGASSGLAGQTGVKRRRAVPVKQQAALPAGGEFVALPVSAQPTGEEELRVIRLELSGNTLRLFGAPVHEEIADRRILADFVVGEDGTPYAVRLVR